MVKVIRKFQQTIWSSSNRGRGKRRMDHFMSLPKHSSSEAQGVTYFADTLTNLLCSTRIIVKQGSKIGHDPIRGCETLPGPWVCCVILDCLMWTTRPLAGGTQQIDTNAHASDTFSRVGPGNSSQPHRGTSLICSLLRNRGFRTKQDAYMNGIGLFSCLSPLHLQFPFDISPSCPAKMFDWPPSLAQRLVVQIGAVSYFIRTQRVEVCPSSSYLCSVRFLM
jgi:hypothetical protein